MHYNEYLVNDEDDDKAPSVQSVIKTLNEYVSHPNINELLDDEERKEIVDYCLTQYKDDLDSMEDWLATSAEILEFMDSTSKAKNTPYKNSANIKLPMISTAVNQLTARIKSELVKNGKVARYKVIGGDIQISQGPDGQPITTTGLKDRKGKRVCKHLNWQMMDKIPNYSVEDSKLIMSFAALGTAFKKTYFDAVENVIRSEFVPYDQLVINHSVSSLEDAESITHKIYKPSSYIVQCQRFGYFTELKTKDGTAIEVTCLTKDKNDHKANKHKLLEQHCWLDLDHDGLPEPYIVTIHEASERILRIVARFQPKHVSFNDKGQIRRIQALHYFSDFGCLESPDGGFWRNGIGSLLVNINDAANSMINILTDAGHLATMQGGFLDKNLRIPPGLRELTPGEWIRADASGGALKDGIVPFNYKEPSAVLFQVLGLLLEQAKSVSATSDLMAGQSSGSLANVSPNVIFSLMENGLQVYSSITKNLALGKRKELKKIVELNSLYVDEKEYLALVSPDLAEMQEMFQNGKLIDYDLDSLELQVLPVVDVNESTEGEKQIRSQAMFQAGMQANPAGAVNLKALISNLFEAMGAENVQQFLAPDAPPAPDPKMIAIQQKGQVEQAKVQIAGQKLQLDQAKMQSDHEIKQQELQIRAGEMQVQSQNIATQNAITARKAQGVEEKARLDHDNTLMKMNFDVQKASLDHTIKQQEIIVKDKIAKIQINKAQNNGDDTLKP